VRDQSGCFGASDRGDSGKQLIHRHRFGKDGQDLGHHPQLIGDFSVGVAADHDKPAGGFNQQNSLALYGRPNSCCKRSRSFFSGPYIARKIGKNLLGICLLFSPVESNWKTFVKTINRGDQTIADKEYGIFSGYTFSSGCDFKTTSSKDLFLSNSTHPRSGRARPGWQIPAHSSGSDPGAAAAGLAGGWLLPSTLRTMVAISFLVSGLRAKPRIP
jgi:hypothetical protein